mmetsp:Transcript_108215/g.338510  ORF Transcript_108215/g.338510 Transcript_108215/m.338510 type:complete len:375 (+) Transcript_108215:1-1125(+)
MDGALRHLLALVDAKEDSSSLSACYCALKRHCDSVPGAAKTRALVLGAKAPGAQLQGALQRIGTCFANGLCLPPEEVRAEVAPGVTFERLEGPRFAAFRQQQLGISEASYLASFSELHGGATQDAGKSGSLFWFTSDGRYILKSATEAEAARLLELLPRYIAHFQEATGAGRLCLLSRFLGLYRLHAGKGEALQLLAMVNVLAGRPQDVYDLKGTTEDRFVTPGDGRVLKDLNLDGRRVALPLAQADAVAVAIQEDTAFLESEDLMDYSLLLGVYGARGVPPTPPLPAFGFSFDGARLVSEEEEDDESSGQEAQPMAIRIGIIDLLTGWTTKKKLAHYLKKPTIGCCREIDTEPPDYYRDRFVSYMEDKLTQAD